MDENNLLERANANLAKEVEGTTSTTPTLREQYSFGSLTGSATPIDQIKEEGDIPMIEEGQGVLENVARFGASFLANAAAGLNDVLSLTDVADWHHNLPAKYGAGMETELFLTPLRNISKYLDNTIGDGEKELGNYFTERASNLRELNDMYNQVNITGSDNKAGGVGGWTEYGINGFANLTGSIVGNLGGAGLTGALTNATKIPKFVNMITGAFAATNATGMSIATGVYEDTVNHYLEQDASYKQQKDSIFETAKKEYLANNPDEGGAKYGNAELYATQKADEFKNQFMQSNPELTEKAKKMGAIGAETALQTNAMSFFLNLGMAKLATRGLVPTRDFEEVMKWGAKDSIKEMGQEASEEAIFENIAEKRGLAYGKGATSYGASDVANDLFLGIDENGRANWKTTLESAFWGAAGGGGTTAIINKATYKNRLAQSQEAIKAIETQNEILKASGSSTLQDLIELNNTAQDNANLVRQQKKLIEEGKNAEADLIGKKMIINQSLHAFKTGTTENLQKVYQHLANDKNNSQEVRDNANKALMEMQSLEQIYNQVHTNNYKNANSVFINQAQQHMMRKASLELDTAIATKEIEVLEDLSMGEKLGLPSLKSKKVEQGSKPGEITISEGDLDFSIEDLFNTRKSTDNKEKFVSLNNQITELQNQIDNSAQDVDTSSLKSELKNKQIELAKLTESTALDIHQTNLVNNYANAAKSKIQSVKKLEELRNSKENLEEAIANNKKDYNELTSRKTQNQIAYERKLKKEFEPGVANNFIGKWFQNTLFNAVKGARDNSSDEEFSKTLDVYFKKHEGQISSGRLRAIKDEIIAAKKKADDTVKQNTIAKIDELAKVEKASTQPIIVNEDYSEMEAAMDAAFELEMIELSNAESTDESSTQDVSNNLANVLGNVGGIDPFGSFGNIDDISIDPADIDKDDLSASDADLLGKLFDPLEAKADLSQEQLSAIKEGISSYKEVLESNLGRPASFEDLVKDFIKTQGLKNADNYFNLLVRGWQLNSYPTVDFKVVYNSLFKTTKEIGASLVNTFQGMVIQPIENRQQLEESTDKLQKEINENIVENPPMHIDIDNQREPIRGNYGSGFVSSNTDPSFTYVSRPAVQLADGTWQYTSKDLNRESTLDNPHKLLDPDKFLPGTKLQVRLADNYESQWITVYDGVGMKIGSMPFRDWVSQSGVVPFSQAWLDKVPMVMVDEDGESVAYVTDVTAINPSKFREVNGGDIEKARAREREIRQAVWDNKEKSVEIEITYKGAGVFEASKLGKDESLISLAQANPQSQLAILDNSDNLIINGKKFDGKLDNENFPMTNSKGNRIVTYDIRRVGTEIIDGKQVPTYKAFPIIQNALTTQDITNIKNAIVLYASSTNLVLSAEKKKQVTDSIEKVRQATAKDGRAGIDLSTPQGLEEFLGQYIYVPKFAGVDNVTQLHNKMSNDNSVKVGTPYVFVNSGVIYFGVKGQNMTSKSPVVYINRNATKNTSNPTLGIIEMITAKPETFFGKMYQNLSKDNMARNQEMVNIGDDLSVQSTGQTYTDFLMNAVQTNMKSFNIGTAQEPKYVTMLQPKITYELTGRKVDTLAPVTERDINQGNTVVQEAEKRIVEVAPTIEKLEILKEQEITSIQESNSSENTKQEQIQQVEQEIETQIQEVVQNVISKEQLEQVKKEALKDTSWIGDNEIYYDPIEQSQDVIDSVVRDMLKVPGLASHHQYQLVEFIFNQLTSQIKFEIGVKLDKKQIMSDVTAKLESLLKEVKTTYNSRREILAAFPDDTQAQELVAKYDEALSYITNIENNADVIAKDGFAKIAKYIGVKETKEDELDIEDNNGIEKDYSKTYLEEGAKSSATLQVKRFLAGIEDVDSQGNIIPSFLGTPSYIGFDDMFNTLQSILAGSSPDLNQMIDILTKYQEGLPFLSRTIERLRNADKQTQNQFVTLMARDQLNMEFVMYSYNKTTGSYNLEIFNTNSTSLIRTIKEGWNNNLKSPTNALTIVQDGVYYISTEESKKLHNEFLGFTEKPLGVKSATRIAILNATSNMNTKALALGSSTNDELIRKELADVSRIVIHDNRSYEVSLVDNILRVKEYTPSPVQSMMNGVWNEEGANILLGWLADFGITLSPNTMKSLVEKGLKHGKGKDALTFSSLFTSTGVFGILGDFVKGRDANSDNAIEGGKNNPTKDTIFNSLAKLESRFNKTAVPNSFRDGSKTIQGFTVSKFITDRAADLISDDQTVREQLKTISFSKHSMWLQLLENPAFRDTFEVTHLGINAIKELGKKLYKENSITSLADADHELTKLGMFMNMQQGESPDVDGFSTRVARLFCPTMSDKTTITLVKTAILNLSPIHFDFKQVGKTEDNKTKVIPKEELLTQVYNQLVKPELERITKFRANGSSTNIKDYDKGAGLFLMFPKLNTVLHEGITLYDLLKGTPNTPGKDATWVETNMKEVIFKEISGYLESEVTSKLKVWETNGYLLTDTDKAVTGFKFFDKKYMEKFDTLTDPGHKAQAIAYDFIINSLIGNANSMMVFAGDPAIYFKSGSQDFVQMSKDTAANMNKRFANQIAPGTKLADSDDNQYIEIFFSDTKVASQNLEFLVKLLDGVDFTTEDKAKWFEIQDIKDSKTQRSARKVFLDKYPNSAKYFEVEGTDGTEYTTWKEHLYVLEKLGKSPDVILDITPSDIRRAREIFSNGTPLEELSEVDKNIVKMVMQPFKPVYTGQQFDATQDVMRTIYIKCSSVPLIPQLTKGLQIDKLKDMMEEIEKKNTPVDSEGNRIGRPTKTVRATFNSATKTGSMKEAPKLFDNQGNINNLSLEQLEANSLTLDRSNFRIQQDVPFKAGSRTEDKVTLGTQTTKILFGDGVTDIIDRVFELEGVKYNGRELHQEYTTAFDRLLQHKKEMLYEDLGIDPKTHKPIDTKKSAKKIGQLLKEEAESRGYSKQVIDSIKMIENPNGSIEFVLPLWMSAESNRFESLLNAIIVNRISKIKMPGNSYVAASQEGFKQVYEVEDTSKIVYTSAWKGELEGASFNEDGSLKKTQVLLPSRFRDNKGNLIDLFMQKDGQYLYVTQTDNGWKLKEDMFDKELLSNISFRIPTSAHLSMVDVEIVGFLPYETGDLMIIPRNLMPQIGIDFDIDKQTNYHLWHKMDENGKFKVVNHSLDNIKSELAISKQKLADVDFQKLEEDIEDAKLQSKENINRYNEEIARLKSTKASQEEVLSTMFTKQKELELMLKGVSKAIDFLIDENSDESVNRLFTSMFGIDMNQANEEELLELEAEKADIERQVLQVKEEISSYSKTKVRKEDLTAAYLGKLEAKMDAIIANYQAVEVKQETKADVKATKTYIKELNKLYEKVLQNRIVKIHSSVLGNPAMQSRVSKVLSIDYAKEQSEMIEKLVEQNQDSSYFTPMSDEYQKANMFLGASGKIGIGAYSIDVVFHSLVMQNTQAISLQDTDGNGVVSPKKVRFGNIESDGKLGNSKTLLPSKINYIISKLYGADFQDTESKNLLQLLTSPEKENRDLGLELVTGLATWDKRFTDLLADYSKNQRAIAEVLGERQNIATDNAKELVMAKVNLNSQTLDVDKVMTLLGFDKGEDGNSITFLFLSQPILRDYVKEIENISSNISEFVADKEAAVIAKLKQKYPTPGAIDDYSSYDSKMTNTQFISELNKADNAFQQAVLAKFIELKSYGQELRKVQQTLNVDSKGLGKSTFDVIDRLKKLDNLVKNKTVANASSLIGDYKEAKGLTIEEQTSLIEQGYVLAKDYYIKPLTVAGSFTINATIPADKLWGQYFPYDTQVTNSIFEELLYAMGTRESGEVERKQLIIQEMRKFVNSMDFDLYTLAPQAERRRLFLDEEGKNTSLATYLQSLMNLDGNKEVDTFIKKNKLLNRFQFNTNSDGNISTIRFNNSVGENFDEEQLYNAIPALMAKKIPLPPLNGKPYNTQMLGQDLINYSLLEGGVQKAIQFSKFIPVAYLNAVGYSANVRGIDMFNNINNFFGTIDNKPDDMKYLMSRFSMQFAQHNPNLFPKVTVKDIVDGKYSDGSKDVSKLESFITKDDSLTPKPFYTIYNASLDGENKFQLYYFTGSNYQRIPTKGDFGMDEYNAQIKDNTIEKSIVESKTKQQSVEVKVEPKINTPPATSTIPHGIVSGGNIGDIIASIASSNYEGLSDMAKALQPFVDSTVKVKVGKIDIGIGAYVASQNAIWMNQEQLKIQDSETLARTFVHEFVHSITVAELKKYIEFDADDNIISVKLNAPAHITELVRLFKQAQEHLNKDGKLDEVIQKMKTMKDLAASKQHISNDKLLTAQEKRVTYGGYNIFEFLTLTTTSPEFQKEMNSVPYKQTGLTLWEKYKQVISKILTAIGVFNENSIAAHAIDNTFKLLEYAKNPKYLDTFVVNQTEVQQTKDLDEEIQTALDLFNQTSSDPFDLMDMNAEDFDPSMFTDNDLDPLEAEVNNLIKDFENTCK